MAKFNVVCPACKGKFPFNADEGMPSSCPLVGCDYVAPRRADDDVVMPFIRSAKTKATDTTYRQMETASEHRAEQAAEMIGVPVSEMSGLKMTNLNDARREGDIAAPLPVAEMANLGMRSLGDGFNMSQRGLEFSQGVSQGPVPNAGARMRTALQNHHGALTGGVGVSDRPAAETMQPGYRRRG